jgi:hypothetical protein
VREGPADGAEELEARLLANGQPRWYHIGSADAVGLADARKLAARVMFAVAEGKDPVAERRAERDRGTFEELAARYVEEHAERENKSWRQADKLVRAYLLPRWAKLQAAAITRGDVKVMTGSIAFAHGRQPGPGRRQRDLHLGDPRGDRED